MGTVNSKPQSVDAADRRALQCGGVRIARVQRQRVGCRGNAELNSSAPGCLLIRLRSDEAGQIRGQRDRFRELKRRPCGDRGPRLRSTEGRAEATRRGQQSQRPCPSRQGDLPVEAVGGMIVRGRSSI